MASDSTIRFTSRVGDYVAARPGYPTGVIETLARECGLGPGQAVADVGSGTGILTADILAAGATVYGVEPNVAMREAAEGRLGGEAGFRSVDGTAEATSLPDASVDLVVAAQAFHWFDQTATRREFARILRGPKWVALIWNARAESGTPFLEGYEALLREHGNDYLQVRHRGIDASELQAWFDNGMGMASFVNVQRFDFDGLLRRLLSSSYAPQAGEPKHEPMVAALRKLFDATAKDGRIEMPYETNVYYGTL